MFTNVEIKMESMEKLRNALKDWGVVVIAFGGAMMKAIEMIATLRGWFSAPNEFLGSLGESLFFIFGSVAIIQAKSIERKLKAELPKISFSRAYVDERVVLIPPQYYPPYSSQTGSSSTPGTILPLEAVPPGFERQETYYFAHITFKNDPMARTAHNVIAEYEFYDDKYHRIPIFNFYGRWGLEKEQPATRDFRISPKKENRMDIPPTGEDYELDIAMKNKTEGFCFAFNDTNFSVIEFRKTDYVLRYEKILICVKLRGEKLTLKPFWFEIQNFGKNNGLEIKEIKSPKNKDA